MSNWMVWSLLAGAVVILEMLTGTFYLLMVALGLLAGAIAAWFNFALAPQLLIASSVATIGIFLLYRSRFGLSHKESANRNPDVNMDIGQVLQVQQWHEAQAGVFVGRASYRGAMWDVELQHAEAVPGTYKITEVQGSKLIVRPV